MEKLTFIEVENELGKILVDKEDIKKATYLPNCVVIDKEAIEEFKERFGIDLNKLCKILN